MATIPDKNFREALSAEGWIVLGEEDNSQCEILEKGLKETILDLDGTSWSNYGIESIEGIEQFPQIEVLRLAYNKRKHSANPVFPPLKVLLSFA